MSTQLATPAIEESTYVVVATFLDENGDAVVPNSVSWTLTNQTGSVINSRTHVSETPASSVNIVLFGDDLKVLDGLSRLLTIEAEYDSSLGSGLPLNDSATFHLEDLVHLPD